VVLWLTKQCSLLDIYHNLILRPPEDHRSYNNELSDSIKAENFLHELSHKKFSTKTLNYGDSYLLLKWVMNLILYDSASTRPPQVEK
jgi:hypothetical protein